jgi:prefoldin subunit 5
MEANKGYRMNQEEYIKFLEERLKHSDEQLEKAMEMLAKLMSKIDNSPNDPYAPPYKVTC